MSYEFDEDTAVVSDRDGQYSVTVTDRWNALGGGPNGGYLAALALRALADIIPHPDPVVVSSTFLRRSSPGPSTLSVETLKNGKRFGTGNATLVQDHRPVVHTTATFADLDNQQGMTAVSSVSPSIPDPMACVDLNMMISLPEVSIVNRVDYRIPTLPGWLRGQPSGVGQVEFWMRFSDERPLDPLSLAFLVDAAAPAVLELGASGSTTIQLTTHVRARPRSDWLVCRLATQNLVDGLHEEDVELWDIDGRLVAQSRQLAVLPSGRSAAA